MKNIERRRDAKLDLLRVLAILECIVAHALVGIPGLSTDEYSFIVMFFPDTAAIFFMASGALILERSEPCGWRYVWHRIWSYLPEFIIFSTLYVFLDHYMGFVPDDLTVSKQLKYMLVTPTWGPGWFILALTGLYFVAPFMWAWVRTATKRQIEIAIGGWLAVTVLPFIMLHTYVDVPMSEFGTIFNFAGYMLIGYYLRRWPLKTRSGLFRTAFFAVTSTVGIVFGYFLGKNGLKWSYVSELTSGLNLTVAMMSLLQYGIVLMLPDRWFSGIFARVTCQLSVLSLGIYCAHWLFIHYWAVPNNVNWIFATVITFVACIPIAWVMRQARCLTKRVGRS